MTPRQVLALRRPRSLREPLPVGGVGSVTVAQGLKEVVVRAIGSHRYAAAAAALTSIGSVPPLSARATVDGLPVGWALAHGGGWRFPFMAAADLQVGLVFVEPNCRRAGVGFQVVAKLVNASASPTGDLWWFCRALNVESVKLAERAGFAEVGRLKRLDTFRGYRFDWTQPNHLRLLGPEIAKCAQDRRTNDEPVTDLGA